MTAIFSMIKKVSFNTRGYIKLILCVSFIFTQNLWSLFPLDIGGTATVIFSIDVVGTANVIFYLQQPDGITTKTDPIQLSNEIGYTFDTQTITDPPIGAYRMGVLVKGVTISTVSINKGNTQLTSSQSSAFFNQSINELYTTAVGIGQVGSINVDFTYFPLDNPF